MDKDVGILEYHRPRARGRFAWGPCFLMLASLATLTGVIWLVASWLEPLLEVFDPPLPWLTARCYWTAWWLRTQWHWAYLLPVAPLVGVAAARIRRPEATGRLGWRGYVIVYLLVLTATVITAAWMMVTPLHSLARMTLKPTTAANGNLQFANSTSLFRYMCVQQEALGAIIHTSPELLTRLAHDSKDARYEWPDKRWLHIIEPDIIDLHGFGQLRGAQGNGSIYVVLEGPAGFELLNNDLEGNGIEYHPGPPARITTSLHMSANEHDVEEWKWDGKQFSLVRAAAVRSSKDWDDWMKGE